MKRPVLFLFCVLFVHISFSARNPSYSSSASLRAGLEISCTVSQKNKLMHDYRILIIENDSVFDTINADLTEPIYIQLDLNKSYVLEFSKPGFQEQAVLVDTKVPSGAVNRRFTYDFEVELHTRSSDTGLYAVPPIARIIYDLKLADFNYDEEYAKSIGNIPTMISVSTERDKPNGTMKRKQKKVTRKKL